MTASNGFYEFVGSGYRQYMDDKAPVPKEAYDITDRLLGDMGGDPAVMALSEETVAKIVEAGRNIGDGVVEGIEVPDQIYTGSPGIASETVSVRGDGEVTFVGELDVEAPIRMTFDFEESLPSMIALYDATKGTGVQLKAMVGAVNAEEKDKLVEMLESENIDNPDLKGYMVWLDRKSGKLYEGANKRPSEIQFVATLDAEPTVYSCKGGKIARDQKPDNDYSPA